MSIFYMYYYLVFIVLILFNIFLVIGVCVIVCSYIQMVLWFHTSQRQGKQIRAQLFRSILRQEIGWFDTHPTGELNTRMAE